jgi:hypothetical protein
MKQFNTMHMALVAALIAAAALVALAGTAAADSAGFGAGGAEGKADLSIEQMLTYAIQDEYLARAEYQLIIQEYGTIRPFTNIMAAEERHIEWLSDLFDEHGYSVPEDTSGRHVVLPEDLKSTFETGVQAEIDNIAMYESFLREDLPEDVRDVFERLKRGSENHLRAFRNNLSRYN